MNNKMPVDLIPWEHQEVLQLIKLVKNNSELYKKRTFAVRSREEVQKLWSEIDFQLRKPPGASRERWANLRAVFRRIYFSSTLNQCRTPWKYYPYMQFIIPCLNPRSNTETTNPVVICDSTETTNDINSDEREYLEIGYQNDSGSVINDEILIEQPPHDEDTDSQEYFIEYVEELDEITIQRVSDTTDIEEPPRKMLKTDNLSNQIESNINSDVTTKVCICNTDSDMMFYRSILSDTKMLTSRQKSDFKIKIQQLLHNMLYNNE